MCLNESQKYCVVWEELSGVEFRIILDRVVEGDEGTLEVLKNCTVQPLFPGSRKSIPELLDTQDREYFRPD